MVVQAKKTRVIVEIIILNISVLGESDLVYTETLLGIGRNEFKDKTILILGGGDGGILHELLKQSPAYVLMAEVRISVSYTHLRAHETSLHLVCRLLLEKSPGFMSCCGCCWCVGS